MNYENPNIRYSVTFHFDTAPTNPVTETVSASTETHAKIAIKQRYPNEDITIRSIKLAKS